MENSTKRGLIAVAIVGSILGIVYYIFNKKKNPTTNLSIQELQDNIWNHISKTNPSSFPDSYKEVYMSSILNSGGKPFMDAWYLAIKNNQPTFTFKGANNILVTYDTKTGVGK